MGWSQYFALGYFVGVISGILGVLAAAAARNWDRWDQDHSALSRDSRPEHPPTFYPPSLQRPERLRRASPPWKT